MDIREQIIMAAIKTPPASELALQTLKRKLVGDPASARQANGDKVIRLPSKTELLKSYHTLLKNKRIEKSLELEKLLMRRAVRSLSGVAIVTSLVKPYPCPGECVYCPLDERMPKSYLSDEPAAMRALTLEFSPYNQMAKRIEALEDNGHPADKIEFILKGGTWNSYPLGYQYWFILKSFEAANRVGVKNAPPLLKLTETSPLTTLKKELYKQQRINEHANHRIIGLTLETRPDCINYHTIWQMREMGCTRLELGIQSTDDMVLALTKRGHTIEESRRATELLRNYGYKVDFHLMPQLPGATPASDLTMMKKVFTDEGLMPDMIKIYPCSVVKGSELYDWFVAGKYEAYGLRELIDVIKEFKTTIPRYCRVSRLIRDIPSQYIENGNTVTNLRQVIEMEMKRDGTACKCLRCREVGHVNVKTLEHKNTRTLEPKLFIDRYETRGGTEYFLSFEDAKRQMVYAFCRLRVVTTPVIHPNKKLNSYGAYVRELHTYGQLISLDKKKAKSLENKIVASVDENMVIAQHTGLGKKLMAEAEKITKKNKVAKLAVISGVGVRGYYRKLGYRLEKTYMVKSL